MDKQNITTDMALINEGNFLNWEGLSKNWTKENLLTLTSNLTCYNYQINENQLSRCLFPLQEQTQPLQCFIDNNNEVVFLRLEDVTLPISVGNLVEELGLPQETLNLVYPNKYAPAKQLIYAKKGITLYILENEKEDKSSLMAISLYNPTSVEKYKNDLGGVETVKFFDDW